MTTTPETHGDLHEYLKRQLQLLDDALFLADDNAAAVAARTIEHEMQLLLVDLDPEGMVAPRVATDNGVYRV